jgi:hypothetical protein
MTNIELLAGHLSSMFRDRSGVAPDFENEARRILRLLNVPVSEDATSNETSASSGAAKTARMP